MAVAGGINGFGRIGRLVARIMAKSDAIDLKLVNSGAANEYMATSSSTTPSTAATPAPSSPRPTAS